jgi:hypothetical protein
MIQVYNLIFCAAAFPFAECFLRSDPEKNTVSFATYPKGRHASADRRDYCQRKGVLEPKTMVKGSVMH